MRSLLILVVLFIPFSDFADSKESREVFVLGEKSFFVAFTPGKDKFDEYQGIIYLDRSYESESIIATICYKNFTYQFLSSATTDSTVKKTSISINMAKLCRIFYGDSVKVNEKMMFDIADNSNILIQKL